MIAETTFKGKTIAITGASRGIGREIALRLLDKGANVAIGSRDRSALQEIADQANGNALAMSVDVTEEESVQAFAQNAIQTFGKVDALINSAGVGVFANLLDLTTEDFERMVAVNLKGTFLCSKYFGRHMVDNQDGHILNLVSIAGTTALPGNAGYAASKFGVLGLSRVMQGEWRQHGVKVTSVIPGAVSSTFWDDINPKPDTKDMITPESLAQHILYLLGQPKDAVIDEITIMPSKGIL